MRSLTQTGSFSHYCYSLYSFNSALNKSTRGLYETKYNSLQKIHVPAEILSAQVLFFREQKLIFLVNITGTSTYN